MEYQSPVLVTTVEERMFDARNKGPVVYLTNGKKGKKDKVKMNKGIREETLSVDSMRTTPCMSLNKKG